MVNKRGRKRKSKGKKYSSQRHKKRKEPLHRHFKNKSDYEKATAYIKMHHIKTRHPKYVYINGRKHKVK